MPENTDYIVQGPYGPINFGPGEEGRQKMIDYQRSLAGESDPIFDDPAFNAQYGGTLPGGNRPWDDLWQRLGIGGSGLEGEPFGPVGELYRGRQAPSIQSRPTQPPQSAKPVRSRSVPDQQIPLPAVVNGNGEEVVPKGVNGGMITPESEVTASGKGWGQVPEGYWEDKAREDLNRRFNESMSLPEHTYDAQGRPQVYVRNIPDWAGVTPQMGPAGAGMVDQTLSGPEWGTGPNADMLHIPQSSTEGDIVREEAIDLPLSASGAGQSRFLGLGTPDNTMKGVNEPIMPPSTLENRLQNRPLSPVQPLNKPPDKTIDVLGALGRWFENYNKAVQGVSGITPDQQRIIDALIKGETADDRKVIQERGRLKDNEREDRIGDSDFFPRMR